MGDWYRWKHDRGQGSSPEWLWVHDDGNGWWQNYGDYGGQGNPRKKTFGDPRIDLALAGPDELEKVSLSPGEYHPRIWRERQWPRGEEQCPREFTSCVEGARNLFARMRDVFRYVEPANANADAYGHEIRNLLILACTEVESSCKAVLRANQYAPAANPDYRWSTNDYVKLLRPMRLDEWKLSFFTHADYPAFRPFEGWDDKNPTKSLAWYDAQNKAKHDREDLFARATLDHMIRALGAVFVMVKAQFGAFAHRGHDEISVEEFRVEALPKWKLSEHYVPPYVLGGKTQWGPAVKYAF